MTIQAAKIRAGLKESLPGIDLSGTQATQEVGYTFVPPSHAKALDPESSLIEGIRGSGKSFWWIALASDAHRKFVSEAYPDAHLSEKAQVKHGFGDGAALLDLPSKDVIGGIVRQYPPRAVWRAVLAQQAAFGAGFPLAGRANPSWLDRVRWVHEHPEEYDALLRQLDKKLDVEDRYLIVAFDALDRLADTWEEIRPLARSLLQVGLDLRATRRVRFKIFVRPDMLDDPQIIGFPDASKLLARRTALTWRRVDLYALLFQCLGNSPAGGAAFRKFLKSEFDLTFGKASNHWLVPAELRGDEDFQEDVFVELAGRAMSASPTGHKRGKPYSWLVNHLLDGREQVSPRSFAAAVREAAEKTKEEYSNYRLPLHFSAIQSGVQSASQVRVNELVKEDYPWVSTLMKPLKAKLTVPCSARDIVLLWRKANVLAELEKVVMSPGSGVKLPPQRLEDGHEGLLQDLQDLGVIQRLTDNRVQMPDVYRIAFGLGRRGGVKPLK